MRHHVAVPRKRACEFQESRENAEMNPKDPVKDLSVAMPLTVNDSSVAVVQRHHKEIRQKVDQLALDAMIADDKTATAKLLRALSNIAAQTSAAGLTAVTSLIG